MAAFRSWAPRNPARPASCRWRRGSWVSVSGPTRLRGASSRELHRAGRLWAALADFHRMALAADDLQPPPVAGRRREPARRAKALSRGKRRCGAPKALRRTPTHAAPGRHRAARRCRKRWPWSAATRASGSGPRPAPQGGQSQDAPETGPSLDRILTASGVRGARGRTRRQQSLVARRQRARCWRSGARTARRSPCCRADPDATAWWIRHRDRRSRSMRIGPPRCTRPRSSSISRCLPAGPSPTTSPGSRSASGKATCSGSSRPDCWPVSRCSFPPSCSVSSPMRWRRRGAWACWPG